VAAVPVVSPAVADLTAAAAAFRVVPPAAEGPAAAGVKSRVVPAAAEDLAAVTVVYPASVAAVGRDHASPLT
jgi:hypothetical protein